MLNDDVVLEPDAFVSMSSSLRDDPNVAVVGALVYDANGHSQSARFAFPSVRSEVAQALILPSRLSSTWRNRFAGPGGSRYKRRDGLGARRRHVRTSRGSARGRRVLWTNGTSSIPRKQPLCYRLARRGWSVVSCGLARVLHLGAASTSSRRYERELGASRGLFIRLLLGILAPARSEAHSRSGERLEYRLHHRARDSATSLRTAKAGPALQHFRAQPRFTITSHPTLTRPTRPARSDRPPGPTGDSENRLHDAGP